MKETDKNYKLNERCIIKWLSCINIRCWLRISLIIRSYIIKINIYGRVLIHFGE